MVQKTFVDSPEKYCPGCEQNKPRSEYYTNKTTLHGLNVYCKACCYKRHDKWRLANKDKAAEQARRWRANHPRAAKDYGIRARYGLPLGSYEKLLTEQEGKCACCGSSKPGGRGDFHVDHCHDTGKIRGLLCHGCNVSIGHFDHDTSLLEKAILYLNRTFR